MFCYFPLRGSVFLAVGASFWKGVIVQMKTGIEKWRELDGDNTLALDWELTEDSHVWEIGGFEGRWAQQIWDKFHCHVTIFEPQLWAVEKMKKRFEGIDKIEIRPYGLLPTPGFHLLFNFGNDGASLYDYQRDGKEVCEFRNYLYEIRDFGIEIDLALINTEGSEWELLPNIIVNNKATSFRYLWCQFHEFHLEKSRAKSLKSMIFDGMNRTHDILWDCYPTAVAWKRK